MVINALICYAVSVLISAAAAAAVIFFMKRRGARLSALHMLFGALSFILVIIGMTALMLYAFSENSTAYITAVMPESVYKLSIASAFFIVIGLVRYFAVNAVYFNRYKEENGISFMAGYGLAGSAITALYCLFMLVYVSVTAVSHKFTGMNAGQALTFEGGSNISVFTPLISHVFAAAIFGVYAALIMIIACFMDQHARLPYRKSSTLLMYIITCGCEILMLCVILFAAAKASAAVICTVCVVIAGLAGLALRMLYKYKEELPYNRQFD